MTIRLPIGTRLFCADGTTAVIVIRAPGKPVEVCCAGRPMTSADPLDAPGCELTVTQAVGLGKRYSDPSGTLELLVTRAGAGPLEVDGVVLGLKEPRRLPASD